MRKCEVCKIEIEDEERFCEGCVDYLNLKTSVNVRKQVTSASHSPPKFFAKRKTSQNYPQYE